MQGMWLFLRYRVCSNTTGMWQLHCAAENQLQERTRDRSTASPPLFWSLTDESDIMRRPCWKRSSMVSVKRGWHCRSSNLQQVPKGIITSVRDVVEQYENLIIRYRIIQDTSVSHECKLPHEWNYAPPPVRVVRRYLHLSISRPPEWPKTSFQIFPAYGWLRKHLPKGYEPDITLSKSSWMDRSYGGWTIPHHHAHMVLPFLTLVIGGNALSTLSGHGGFSACRAQEFANSRVGFRPPTVDL